MFSSALAGLGLGLSLIVAIGAQNVFVLRQGIRREHVFVVAAICALSDLTLIIVGVSGIGAVLQAVPWLVDVIRWVGAAFLVGYGVLAARRAFKPGGEALVADEAQGLDTALRAHSTDEERTGHGTSATVLAPTRTRPARSTLTVAVLTCLALTWLNPHVYLDTVFLLGSVANTHGDGRWAFAAGAGVASIVWFFGLAYGARLLGRVLASHRAWRILDALIAVVMVTLGVLLVLPH
ncbi:LysE/ArgO family amino acid transporter [Agromyces sp. SYSU K20354]|uniref:LysE/ArgO family amino acid transporter n=1 Tax=Agromyces cavernae TaxID=2898659 RepID=UPI001E524CB8|nr:LysE/ArgO family amino acid transporter [Agromyces cavernae]MCD2443317.1 LysE/ArgO family amino acid transporter [Agromyces cavernae]